MDSSLGTVEEITEEQDPPKRFVNTKSLRTRPCNPPPPPAYMLGTTDVTSADMMLPTVISKNLFIVLFCTVNGTTHSPFIN
jgi:hypothetical protein